MANLSASAYNALVAAHGAYTAGLIRDAYNSIDVLSATEAGYLDSVTAGTAAASKAVVLDASSQIDAIDIIAPSFNGMDFMGRTKTIAISTTPDGSEEDTGWDIPTTAIVLNVYLRVTTAEATGGTKTMDVGTLSTDSGDANGFLAAVSCAATGLVKGTLASAGQTLGALLRVDESGAGVLVPEPCTAPGSVSVTYTAGSNDWAEFVGEIIVHYLDLA